MVSVEIGRQVCLLCPWARTLRDCLYLWVVKLVVTGGWLTRRPKRSFCYLLVEVPWQINEYLNPKPKPCGVKSLDSLPFPRRGFSRYATATLRNDFWKVCNNIIKRLKAQIYSLSIKKIWRYREKCFFLNTTIVCLHMSIKEVAF